MGHQVFLVTLSPEGTLHQIVTALGVKVYSSNTGEAISIKNLFTNTRFLIRFCRQHQIDVILAHQQVCALPLIFASPFLKCRSYYIRHNTDEGYEANPAKAKLLNRFINNFAKKIITPSNIVYKYLNETEKVPAKKMIRINYGYNFEQYEKPDFDNVAAIRNEYNCGLLIISIARLVEAKRHFKMFAIVKKIHDDGVDCKFICLGAGHLFDELQAWIKDNKMEANIFLLGKKSNVLDYLSAADLLLHLSETEASNSVVKEAGLAKKAAVVCKAVGDFEDYISSNENGFLVNKENPEEEAIHILKTMGNNKSRLKEIGEHAQQTITSVFDISNVEKLYAALLN